MNRRAHSRFRRLAGRLLPALAFVTAFVSTFLSNCSAAAAQSQDTEKEIVANLAGGRVIVHVTKDNVIVFAAIDHPVEAGSVPPRVADLDSTHIGVMLGASEWRLPADPKPIRLDRDFQRIGRRDPRNASDPTGAEPDLETFGVAFLETLRPLTGQLHHKIDIASDEPLFEIVIIGFAPNHYGPEVWTVEYRIQQEQVGVRAEYWQTRILRPRFTQLYPPEKHAPRTIVEARYPSNVKAPTVMEMIQGNDPRVAQLRNGEPRFGKVLEVVDRGQAQKAVSIDAQDFMRALLPLIAGKATFMLGKMDEERGLDWIVPPEEPVDKTKKDDKDRPPDAPSLRKKPQR
jgi:hypothetical protein